MTEADAIAASSMPWTRSSLVDALRGIGVRSGMVLSVHSSLSKLGWVVGGAQTVVESILEAVGPDGTILMQTHTGENSDPSIWENPPIPEAWWQTYRDNAPPFNPAVSRTRSMGVIVETFRNWPGVVRSEHPSVSCAALGPLADLLTQDHPLTPGLGPGSPISRLLDYDAFVLLVGIDHGNDTLLHVAEHRADWPGKSLERIACSVMIDGERRWIEYEDLSMDDSCFAELGEDFATAGRERCHGPFRLSSAPDLIEFAVPWIEARRSSNHPAEQQLAEE